MSSEKFKVSYEISTLYFEVPTSIRQRGSDEQFDYDDNEYFCYTSEKTDLVTYPNIAYKANRIWKETSTGVVFMKNRWQNPETTTVDMKEFMWIKLKSSKL